MALAPFRSDRIPFAGSNSPLRCSTACAPAQTSFGGPHPLFCRRKKTCLFRQVSKMVGERGLLCSASSALRAVAEATLSRYAPAQTSFGGPHPLFCRRKKTCLFRQVSKMVGERGFEPPTHWSQTSCATKLRYSPIFLTVLPGAKRGT